MTKSRHWKHDRRRSGGWALCLALLLALALPLIGSAQAPEQKVVRVGWYESPFNYVDSYGRRSGLAYEYQQRIAAHTGWTYEYVEGSWPELLQMLREGRLDLMSDVSFTEERATQMRFSALPMGTEGYYVFVAQENREITVSDIHSLDGKTVGVNRGSVQRDLFLDWAEKNGIHAELAELTGSEEESVRMLLDGELDAYVTIDAFGDTGSYAPVIRIGQSDFYFAVSNARSDLLPELNEALSKIQDEDRNYNQELYDRYIRKSGTAAFLPAAEAAWLEAHGPVRVGYLDDYLPFCGTEGGTLTGGLRDYLDLASASLQNAALSFESLPYPTLEAALEALHAGELDCVFPIHLSAFDAEDMDVLVTGPFIETEMYAAVRKSEHLNLSAESALRAALNGTNPNFTSFLRDNYPGWSAVYFNDLDACFRAVRNGSADCALFSNYRLLQTEAAREKNDLTAVATGANMNFSFAVRRSDSALYYILNKTAGLVSGTQISAALTNYSYPGAAFSLSQFLSDILPYVLGALLVLVLLIVWTLVRHSRRVRTELEARVRLQQQLLQQEQEEHKANAMITAMAADYRSVFYVDLDRDVCTCYRASPAMRDELQPGEVFPYRSGFTNYANQYVVEADRARFLAFIEPERIRAGLAEQPMIGLRYLSVRNGEERYEMLRMAGVRTREERSDDIIHAVGIGFSDVDRETREDLAQHQALSDALQREKEELESRLGLQQKLLEQQEEERRANAMITAMAADYRSVYYVDLDRNTATCFRASEITDYDIKPGVTFPFQSVFLDYAKRRVAKEDQVRFFLFIQPENIRAGLAKQPMIGLRYLTVRDGVERYEMLRMAGVRTREERSDGIIHAVGIGFSDVDRETREDLAKHQALSDALQREKAELETRLALQEQLLEQQEEERRANAMITAMAADYRSVFYVDLDRDESTCYRARYAVPNEPQPGEQFPFREGFTHYAQRFVAEADREQFLRFIEPENIRAGLARQPMIALRFLSIRDGAERYEMLRMAGVRTMEERSDDIIHAVGVGFSDVDSATREDLARQQALSDALGQANTASAAKTSFLSSMSHEIRTPMNAIIGLNAIALKEPDLPPHARESLEKLGVSAKHLLELINGILDMSRIESGRMSLRNEEFSFRELTEQINTIIQGQCQEKGLQYDYRVLDRADDFYIGDAGKLRQALINILGNAVKYTPAPGTVSFLVEPLPKYEGNAPLRFTVRDTGIGMDKSFLPQIFDAFAQEDVDKANKLGSTGLGLAITKNIVEMMNGRIEVESEKGKGSTFTVTVTLRASERTEEADAGGEMLARDLRVLIVDDDPVACEHAQSVLDEVGIYSDACNSGQEAYRLLELAGARQQPYSLILVDWRMPEEDGVAVAHSIRERYDKQVPIILLTAYDWEGIQDEALAAGADSFLTKPLQSATVLQEFRHVLLNKERSQPETPRAELEGRHILLAEDMELNAEIVMELLSMRDITTDLAENGKIAVDLFAASAPGSYDAVLMDIRMPVMDGHEATRRIRALDRPDAKAVPIIALSANALDEDVQRSLQAGMDAHLSKPVEPERLFDTLEVLIGAKPVK
ncbi:MAG: response regulator [Oscillospiraceae bacterium]|nr:response regulator [Oscillospiraceae bacterium]